MAKKYLVEITALAEADIRYIHDYIAEDDARAADRWADRIERMILRLELFPRAHEVIPESAEFGIEYRHKLFGKYRIIYRIDGGRVIVLRVFHSARLLDQTMLDRP